MKWYYLKHIPEYRKPDYNTDIDREKKDITIKEDLISTMK